VALVAKGWKGVLVEAMTAKAHALILNIKSRSRLFPSRPYNIGMQVLAPQNYIGPHELKLCQLTGNQKLTKIQKILPFHFSNNNY
jgi:hypothetical protein